MLPNGVGIVFLHVVAPLSGDLAEVGPPTDGAFYPPGQGTRFRVDVQLGDRPVLAQPGAVVRHRFMCLLGEKKLDEKSGCEIRRN